MPKVRTLLVTYNVFALLLGGMLFLSGCEGGGGTAADKAPPGGETEDMKAQRKATEDFYKNKAQGKK